MSESYVVYSAKGFTLRRCPFCDRYVKDEPGKDINFILHMGRRISEHTGKRGWREYIMMVNRA